MIELVKLDIWDLGTTLTLHLDGTQEGSFAYNNDPFPGQADACGATYLEQVYQIQV